MELFDQLNIQGDNVNNEKNGNDTEHVKCLILGSGPAGYTAAIYAARANLKPVLYTGMEPGGQLTTTTEVENYPGYPDGIMGPDMMEEFKKQAMRFNTDIRFGVISSVDFSTNPHKVTIDNQKNITADAVIIATGARAKYLGLESEEKFKGSGVSACATCDGFFYRGKDVAVVGGGDTAAEEALYLSGLCNKVYIIVRKDYMRASKVMQQRIEKAKNIEVLYQHVTKEIVGDQVVKGVVVLNKLTNEEVKLEVDGFFVAIGHQPNTEIFKEYLELDEDTYIKVKPGTSKTNIEGVFACGDVMDRLYKQAVTAAGSGCKAALDAERYIGELSV
jgi:thioredoxin reductase (NADPH)